MFSISKEDQEGNQQRTRRAGIQYAIQYAAPCTYALPAAHRCYQGIVALAVVQYVLAPFLQQNVNDCVEPSRSLSDVMASLFSACQHYCTSTVPSRENESTLQSAAAVPARIFRGADRCAMSHWPPRVSGTAPPSCQQACSLPCVSATSECSQRPLASVWSVPFRMR